MASMPLAITFQYASKSGAPGKRHETPTIAMGSAVGVCFANDFADPDGFDPDGPNRFRKAARCSGDSFAKRSEKSRGDEFTR